MTQSAALRGCLFAVAGVTLAGAIWGGIARPDMCCRGGSDFFTAAKAGGLIALIVFSLPIGLVGVFLASGDESPERRPDRKPGPHPLDD